MLAKINGVFRLTRDIELKKTEAGVEIGKLGLACSEKYKNKETVLFLDAVCFGKIAEVLAQYAGTKGTQIYLHGKLQTERWQTQTGENRSKNSMAIEGFEFIGNKQSAPDIQKKEPTIARETIPLPDVSIDEDEIPF